MYKRPCVICGKIMEGEYDKRVKSHATCMSKCSVEGCMRATEHVSAGLCKKHYGRWVHNKPLIKVCAACGIIIEGYPTNAKRCPDCQVAYKLNYWKVYSKTHVKLLNGDLCSPVGNNADCPNRKVRCEKQKG